MAASTEEEGKGFKVHDRRRFSSETGEAVDETEERATVESETAVPESPRQDGARAPLEDEVHPPIDFPTFIISLSTQVLMHLGEIPSPLSGKVEKEVRAAKQTIDIISLLHDKTRGNLDQEEEKLMEEILFNLRMKYVEAVRTK